MCSGTEVYKSQDWLYRITNPLAGRALNMGVFELHIYLFDWICSLGETHIEGVWREASGNTSPLAA